MSWNYTEPPKDGSKILRWHSLWKATVSVYWDERLAKEANDNCYWVDSTRTNRWPEEAFLPGWRQELTPPNTNIEDSAVHFPIDCEGGVLVSDLKHPLDIFIKD